MKEQSNCAKMSGVGNFEHWVERVAAEKRDLACRLHSLTLQACPDFEESIKWNNPCFSINGVKRCYIAEQRNYMHMGFYNGSRLSNTDGVIEGTGKFLRHIKVRKLTPELEARIKAAVKESALLPPDASSP